MVNATDEHEAQNGEGANYIRDTLGWKPSRVGEVLEGTLLSIRNFESPFNGETKMVLEIIARDGKRYKFVPSTDPERKILDRYFAKVIDIGKPIRLTYQGLVKVKAGELKSYRIDPDLPADWQRNQAANVMERFRSKHGLGPSGKPSPDDIPPELDPAKG